jgi:GTP cyclohydrolase I
MDKKKIETAVRLFLEGIGEDPDREGLVETPARVSAMCQEIFCGLTQDGKEHMSKTFSGGGDEIVLEKDISFYSVCEHHLLPFYGKVHIGYIPDGRVVGLSKLARTVEVYAKRPQIQEQMTAQIADDIMRHLKPRGVMVMTEAEHMCMTMRGVKKPGSKTITYAVRGEMEDNFRQEQFMRML